MCLAVPVVIIKGTQTSGPKSTRSGYTMCMTNHQSETEAGVPALLVSPSIASWFLQAWMWGSKGAPYTLALLASLWKSGKSCSDKSTSIFLASFGHQFN